ncbi:uncharacterized protein TNCT_390971 [Trichonephila clavata]|uniref:Uncharacterized protein n=1 Tax=Trichonephila clavata TaxID=2740835 RepID=A0A8X6L3B9_TRICU|nr:uncharacterized protein TNCT_390971 [Trichonephila clavata]
MPVDIRPAVLPMSTSSVGWMAYFNAWTSILGDYLLGPYLMPERLSRQSYLVFLNEVLTEFLDDIPLAAIQGLCFQHDGCSCT